MKLYDDSGITGSDSLRDRKAIMQLLEDAGNEIFDIVLAVHVDRIARDVADYKQVEKLLKNIGVAIVETSNPDVTTLSKDGRLLTGIKAEVAQYERESMLERQKRVLSLLKEKGRHLGRIPLGFELKDGFLAPDELGKRALDILTNNPQIKTSKFMVQLGLNNDYWKARNLRSACGHYLQRMSSVL